MLHLSGKGSMAQPLSVAGAKKTEQRFRLFCASGMLYNKMEKSGNDKKRRGKMPE